MAGIERLTITLPTDTAAAVKQAIQEGGYASTSEVVREALRDWKHKRALQRRELTALKADIAQVWPTSPPTGSGISTPTASLPGESGNRPPRILRLTDAAEGDLAELKAYLAREATGATATRPIEAVHRRFDQVLAFPHSGPAREQLAPGLRVEGGEFA